MVMPTYFHYPPGTAKDRGVRYKEESEIAEEPDDRERRLTVLSSLKNELRFININLDVTLQVL